jgi:transposase InsO family protein
MEDGRCKLGLLGRFELVMLIEQGSTLRQAAACLSVAPATAHRWWHRWQRASEADRASRACLRTRSSRPRSCPWALSSVDEQVILNARAKTNYGPMQLQFLTGRHRSTIWKVLNRHGVSRQRRSERPQSTRRYEWTEAGALLHIDAFELPKFDRPGHWAHGDRCEPHRTRQAGKVKVIGVIDDHTRLAYCEIHSAENATAVSATLRRAAAWFLQQGCGPVQAVMSDNAKCYATSFEFRDTLSELGARHILIPPRTPRWNGKIERFFRTLDTEWAHRRVWANSATRDRALSSFLRFYNRRRPHTACGGRAPTTRVQHLRGQDS